MPQVQTTTPRENLSDRVKLWFRTRREKGSTLRWERSGRPVPPPHTIKQAVIREYAQRFGIKSFVETGTFRGDMVDAMKNEFEQIVSIELSEELFAQAEARFQPYEHIKIIQGDSGSELGKLLPSINQPTLFWLDGHYSAGETARGDEDTPINNELSHIFRSPDLGHVVLIDDARCFGTYTGYPSLDAIQALVCSFVSGYEFHVEDDIVRLSCARDVALQRAG